MTIVVSEAVQNAACDAAVDRVDLGSGGANATLEIRDGTTVLAVLNMSNPAFGDAGAVNPGEAVADVITGDASADATGTADNFQIKDRDGNVCFSGSITTTAVGTGDITMPSVDITATEPVDIDDFAITLPDGS